MNLRRCADTVRLPVCSPGIYPRLSISAVNAASHQRPLIRKCVRCLAAIDSRRRNTRLQLAQPMHTTGQPQHIWNTLPLAFSHPVHAPASHSPAGKKRTKHSRGYAHPGLVHATNVLPTAQCALRFAGRRLFLAHPRRIPTQSSKDMSTRLVAGAAELFHANALPFSFNPHSLLSPCCLLALATSIHSLSRPGVDTPYDTLPAGLHYAL